MNAERNDEVWKRLVTGKSLEGLGLGQRNGRIDLTGLAPPKPSARGTVRTSVADVTVFDNITHFKGVKLRSLDFSGCCLEHLRFSFCDIQDCQFVNCVCEDWRLWSNAITDSSFHSADLRNCSLGGVIDGKRGVFRGVDFTKADLRGSFFSPSAELIGCTFSYTRLTKVDFCASCLTDCSFEGRVEGVHFYRSSTDDESFPPNEMLRVDFSSAELRQVEFRGLDLDQVRFPSDSNHIVTEHFPDVLDWLLKATDGKTDRTSRRVRSQANFWRKWLGPKQRRGVMNKTDLLEWVGEEGLGFVLEAVQSTSG